MKTTGITSHHSSKNFQLLLLVSRKEPTSLGCFRCLILFSSLFLLIFRYGACERIIKSAVPESYSRHNSRMLSVFCFTLPFALVHSLGWRMIPAVATICWMLFTIEEVGHTIEDPFNLHPLDPIWTGAEDQLRIEVSLGVLRGDTLERIPAVDPAVYADTASKPFTDLDYDVAQFHEDWKKTAR